VILEIYNATKEGRLFSDSLERFPAVFPSLFVNIIKAGETSGRLDLSLEQISEYLYREQNLRTRIGVALAYPSLLLLVGLASIFVLINFVIPKLRPIFEGLGNELPMITKVVLGVSAFSKKSWWLVGIVAGIVGVVLYLRTGGAIFNRWFKKIKVHLPVVKRLVKNQELANFSRALSLLLKSGVPALKSLEVATPSIEEQQLREQLKKVCQQVAQGQTISHSLETLTGLPSFFTKMIAVGEESGRLAEVLDEISHSYTQQLEADIALTTSLLEPVLILALGLVLGTIVIAILLPTFQITQFVR
jgi:type II secretory pathway component PulF